MPPPSLRELFAVGLDVIASTLDATTGVLSAVLGDSTSNTTDSPGAEWIQHTGFWSNPAPPSAGAPSCQTVVIRQGDRDVIIGSRDTRAADRPGNLKPGETCVGATVGYARTLYKADGSLNQVTTEDNTATGKNLICRQDGDGWVWSASFGTMSFDKNGWRIRHASGFRVDAGAIGSLPGPLSALGAYFKVTAPTITLKSPLVQLGSGPAYNPAVFGLAENPLTTPGVPIVAIGFSAPIGIFSSTSVRVSGLPGTG